MGAVWLARLSGKHGFEQHFAIKVILEEDAIDEVARAGFLDEVRLTASIRHPNVVRVVDFGEVEGMLYVVMAWVDGESLRRRATPPLALGPALRIVCDACAGLHAAHELRDPAGRSLNVVHRDVSPQNILVTDDGAAVLIDFGIAKARERRVGDTTAGRIKGKPRYLAPEQARGLAIDRRADVWALGAVLYELVTGEPVHDGDTTVDVIRAALEYREAPPMVGVPRPLAAVLERALAVEPNDRYDTAEALERALLEVMHSMGCLATHVDVARALPPTRTPVHKAELPTLPAPAETKSLIATALAATPQRVPPPARASFRYVTLASLSALLISVLGFAAWRHHPTEVASVPQPVLPPSAPTTPAPPPPPATPTSAAPVSAAPSAPSAPTGSASHLPAAAPSSSGKGPPVVVAPSAPKPPHPANSYDF